MDMVVCPTCGTRVFTKADGTCPSCQAVIPPGAGASDIQPTEPPGDSMEVEEFGYKKYWKVSLLILAGALTVWGFLMLGVGLFFVFPSGGVIQFGGMGWLFFILAPLAAIGGFVQYSKAMSYSVELSEWGIRVGKESSGWADIVKMETHMTVDDRATQTIPAIRLTTRQGKTISLHGMTENLFYIKQYIEQHAKNL
jgi:hypothetical protein